MRRWISLLPTRRQLALAAAALLWIACGGENNDSQADAAPQVDEDGCVLSAVEIGYCIDPTTDEPCLDFEAADRQFVTTGSDVVVPAIVGPQGSDMFVLAVRGAGIDIGTPMDRPRVSLRLFHNDEDRGGYGAWPDFFTDETQQHIAPHLYVVVFQASELEGDTVRVSARVTDRTEAELCGEGEFVVGTVLPGNGEEH